MAELARCSDRSAGRLAQPRRRASDQDTGHPAEARQSPDPHHQSRRRPSSPGHLPTRCNQPHPGHLPWRLLELFGGRKRHVAIRDEEPMKRRDVAIQRQEARVVQHLNPAVVSQRQFPHSAIYASRHLIEQPMPGCCSGGPSPVLAISRIASYRSRGVPSGDACLREASSRPR